MGRRRIPPRCRGCRLERLPDETFWGGYCPACRDERARRRRQATGANVLARARDGGAVERNGRTFQVTVLPPKRKRGRRRRP